MPVLIDQGDDDQFLADQARQWLDEAAATVPDDIEVATHVSFGESFAEGLIEESARLGAEAIVVGAAGDGLIGRYSVGSVTGELLHSSPVPVVVAPRGARHTDVDRVREVTCAIGERQGADLLLRTAVRFSKAAGTPLRLASLVALDPTYGHLRGDADAVRERALEHAQQTLEAAKAALPEGIPVTSTVVDGATVCGAAAGLPPTDVVHDVSRATAAPSAKAIGTQCFTEMVVMPAPSRRWWCSAWA